MSPRKTSGAGDPKPRHGGGQPGRKKGKETIRKPPKEEEPPKEEPPKEE